MPQALGDTTPNHCPVDQPTGGLVQYSLFSSYQASRTAFVEVEDEVDKDIYVR